MVKEKNPELPLYLYGHSMGGLITFLYLSTDHSRGKIDGSILSSPALKFPLGITEQIQMTFASVIRNISPKMAVEVELDTTKLTDIPFEADELRLPGITVSLGDELNKASALVHEGGVRPINTAPEFTTQENILILDEALHEPFNSSESIRKPYLEGIQGFLERTL